MVIQREEVRCGLSLLGLGLERVSAMDDTAQTKDRRKSCGKS